MEDLFDNPLTGHHSPATYLAAITPSESASVFLTSRMENLAGERAFQARKLSVSEATTDAASGKSFPVPNQSGWTAGINESGSVVLGK